MDLPSTEDVDARDYQSASPGGSDNDNDIDPDGDNSMTDLSHPSANKNGNGKPAASNAKDPNRPRRKKARRACFACQRAHLTCGMYLSTFPSSLFEPLSYLTRHFFDRL